jgi:hypothetical protein
MQSTPTRIPFLQIAFALDEDEAGTGRSEEE